MAYRLGFILGKIPPSMIYFSGQGALIVTRTPLTIIVVITFFIVGIIAQLEQVGTLMQSTLVLVCRFTEVFA